MHTRSSATREAGQPGEKRARLPTQIESATVPGSCPTVTFMLKALIIILLIGVVVSLFTGLGFLFKDSDKVGSRRTLYALGVRVTLAATLLALTFYGIYTGELGLSAPWHGR